MPKLVLQFRFSVADDPIAVVPIDDMQDTFGRLTKIVIATALDAGFSRSDVTLSVAEFQQGENALLLTGTKPAFVALDRVVRAVLHRDFSLIPAKARQDIRVLWSKVKQRGWIVVLRDAGGNEAFLSAKNELPAPETETGTTTVAGKLMRADPASSAILLKLPSGDARTFATESEDLVREIGKKRYQEIVLRGIASWFVGTEQLADFIVTGIEKGPDQ